MKGLILSGGKGTRLRPLTFTQAKQLVPVANKPVLFYGIEALRDAGIADIGIIVGDTRRRDPRRPAGTGRAGASASRTSSRRSRSAWPTPSRRPATSLGDDPFVMYLGDNILTSGIAPLVEEFRRERRTARSC